MNRDPQTPIEDVLKDHDVFMTLKPEFRTVLAKHAKRGGCKEGTVLFKAGEPALNFYIIERGSVRLEAYAPPRGSVTIGTLQVAEVLGWSWLIPPYDWHFNAVAAEPVSYIAFDAAYVRTFCDSNHEFGYELLKRFSQIMLFRLMATRYQVLDLYGKVGG